jgi:choline dehydrogenase-like flavoprotein
VVKKNLLISVIGGGPIGLATAYALIKKGFRVVLVEAGNFTKEEEHLTIDNYIFKSESLLPPGCHKIGGGANYWIGRIGEFLPLDFDKLNLKSRQSWPFKFNEFEPYYNSLFKFLGEDKRRDKDIIRQDFGNLTKLLPKNFEYRLIRYAKKDFFRPTLTYLSKQKNFEILASTKCLKLEFDGEENPNRYVLHLSKKDSFFNVTVDKVVIACGALNSPILLKNSAEIFSRQANNNVGVGLMEHFDGFIGKAFWNRKEHINLIPNLILNRYRTFGASRKGLALKLSEDIREKESLINLHFEFVPETLRYKFTPNLKSKNVGRSILYLLERILKKIFSLARNQFRDLIGKQIYSVWVKAEELPNKESTVSYLNCFGLSQKTVYDHKVSKEAELKFIESLNRIKDELRSQKVCDIRFDKQILDGSAQIFEAINWHPMGTLKMSSSPKFGVCDKNLKVFGTSGIYVTDASVFPTGSNSNPTSTAIALAFRLADHLSKNFKEM